MPPLGSLGATALRPGRRLAGYALHRAQNVLAEPTRDAVLLTVDATLAAADAVLTSSLAHDVVGRVAASPLVDDAMHRLTQTIGTPETGEIVAGTVDRADVERVVGRVVESPLVDVAVTRVIDSRLMDLVVARLLESEALWVLVDEIAQSPSVTAAISRQGVGFANQLADVARDRSRAGDARLERLAARLARRRPRPSPASGDEPVTEP